MAISITLNDYLSNTHVDYDILKHKHTTNAFDTAYKSQISMANLAKAVVLQDADGEYLMAVLPSQNKLKLKWISRQLHRRFNLAPEQDLKSIFQDCDLGAIPAVGNAYKMKTICDEQLLESSCVYIEGGDHQALIKLKQDQFAQLMKDVPHHKISKPFIHEHRVA
ncbi:aminoacyl-tRNA deacylase [Motiliproteus sp. MSK22-1]|uniref:aminoacyl-tRNA deacylase n=1 Tax=Motiliproteus sp. MSK22-1 TaxID=1897630 RepID=UPI000978676B|nr:YbaK/EbsC family protein [Motiliproteus sp. MSK22-1]OMH32756.1 hypothetical protein BGP75_14620 [Motiliproteus sp. MSK22-1]